MANVMDCDIVLSEFELQSHYYYAHFKNNNLGKGMKPLILSAMELTLPLTFFFKYYFGIK